MGRRKEKERIRKTKRKNIIKYMPKYTTEQILSLYKKLSPELKDALGAEETANVIEDVFKKFKLSEEQLSKLVDSVRDVLMGLLPPEEFQETLETESGLESEIAKKISFQIDRYIFRPVKESLKLLYEEERPEKEKMPEEEEKKPQKRDTYREPIE